MTIKLDIRVNLAFTNRNWATGKTHIDSALQSLKKGLSALLDMIVAALKVIAKVASMLLEVIKKIVMRTLIPMLEPVTKNINNFLDEIKNALYYLYISIFPGEVTNTRVDSNYSLDDEINHFSTIIMGTFFTLVFMFWFVVEILEKVIQRIYPIALPIYILIIGAVMLGIVYSDADVRLSRHISEASGKKL